MTTTALTPVPPTLNGRHAPLGEFTEVGWIPPADMTYDEWENYGRLLQRIDNGVNWAVGDWLNEGERRWGETYTQAIELLSWTPNRLMTAKWVAGAIPRDERNPDLPWSKHKVVAPIPDPQERQYWLQRSIDEGLNSHELRAVIREEKGLPPPYNPLAEAEGALRAIADFSLCFSMAADLGYVYEGGSESEAWLGAAIFLSENFNYFMPVPKEIAE